MGNHLLANQSDGKQHLTLIADNATEEKHEERADLQRMYRTSEVPAK